MRFIGFICMTVGFIMLTGCATTRVLSDYDHSVEFGKYKTFNWLPKSTGSDFDKGVKNGIVDKRFKRLLQEELKHKGYLLATTAPDFYISYDTVVKEREGTYYSHFGCLHHGHHRRHGHHHFGHGYHGSYQKYSYDETTITIDIIDAKAHELVWRGWTSEQAYGPSLHESAIQRAVTDVLLLFPPPTE